MREPKKITLTNICGGAAAERFEVELRRVLENIADPNTDTGAKRAITLKFQLKPDAKGRFVDIAFDIETKLASTFKGAVDSASIAMDENQQLFLYSEDVRQHPLPLQTTEPPVTEIRAVSPPIAQKPANPTQN